MNVIVRALDLHSRGQDGAGVLTHQQKRDGLIVGQLQRRGVPDIDVVGQAPAEQREGFAVCGWGVVDGLGDEEGHGWVQTKNVQSLIHKQEDFNIHQSAALGINVMVIAHHWIIKNVR